MRQADLPRIAWRSSSHSNQEGGNCVEVVVTATHTAVRDSKDRAGPVLAVPAAAWVGFLAAIDA